MVFKKEEMSQELHEDLEMLAKLLIDFAGTTIIVTGATGLIGSLLLKAIVEFNESHNKEMIHGIGFARNPEKVALIYKKLLDYSSFSKIYVLQYKIFNVII